MEKYSQFRDRGTCSPVPWRDVLLTLATCRLRHRALLPCIVAAIRSIPPFSRLPIRLPGASPHSCGPDLSAGLLMAARQLLDQEDGAMDYVGHTRNLVGGFAD